MMFKKIIILLLVAGGLQHAVAQVQLATHHLELKRPDAYHDILPAPEAEHRGLVVFAADKENVTALRYTRVLYYADSLATERPSTRDYELMAGYSYSASGQPSAYWANTDYTKIQELQFDFETRKVNDYAWEMPYKSDEQLVITFSANNAFYIITQPITQPLWYVYVFRDGRYMRYTADFTGITFKDKDGRPTTLSSLLAENGGLQKMEYPAYNPLPAAATKLKLYVTENAMQLTFDQNMGATQLLTIDAATYRVSEKIIPQPLIDEDGDTNAFLHQNKLYQVALSKQEIKLQATDLATGTLLQSYSAGRQDTIGFKNSPLLEQTDNRPTHIFKNTQKFLRKAAWGAAAITVYHTPNDVLVVSGAIRQSYPAGQVVLGSLGTVAMAGVGVGGSAFDMMPEHIQSVYIESLFDDGFNHKNLPQQHLAADYIGRYMYEHEKQVSLPAIFPYDYYYVAGYYDARAKKYVMVKFQDDGIR